MCREGRQQHLWHSRPAPRLRPAPVWRRPRADLRHPDRHGPTRTLPPSSLSVSSRSGRTGRRWHHRHRQARRRVLHRRHGDLEIAAVAGRKAQEFVQWATELRREEVPLSDLWIATKCGESDTTSGLASNPTVGNMFDKLDKQGTTCVWRDVGTDRCRDGVRRPCRHPRGRQKFLETWNRYNDMINLHKTSDLSDSQPTAGNIAVVSRPSKRRPSATSRRSAKSASTSTSSSRRRRRPRARVCTSWTRPRQPPRQHPPGRRRFALHIFTTGQGNIIGHPIMP